MCTNTHPSGDIEADVCERSYLLSKHVVLLRCSQVREDFTQIDPLTAEQKLICTSVLRESVS